MLPSIRHRALEVYYYNYYYYYYYYYCRQEIQHSMLIIEPRSRPRSPCMIIITNYYKFCSQLEVPEHSYCNCRLVTY